MAAPDLQQVFQGVLTPTQLMQQRLMRDTELQNTYGNDTSRPWRLELARSLDNAAYQVPGTPQYQTQQIANDNQSTLNAATKKYQSHLDSGMSADDAQLAVLNDAITDFANKGNYDAVSALAPSYLALQQKQAAIAKLYQDAKKDAVDTAARAQDSNSQAALRTAQIDEINRKAKNDESTVNTKDVIDLVNPKLGPVTAAVQPDGSIQYTDPQSSQLVTRKPGQYKTAPTANSAATSDARTQMFVGRVSGAADQAIADLSNIVRSPTTANGGFFGSDYKGTILDMPKSVLAQQMNGSEVRQYQTLFTGLASRLAQIETQGLAPGGGFMKAFDRVQFTPADTQYDKMIKLGQARQIIERGLNPALSNPRVPDETKDYIRGLQDQIKQVIPFTIEDVQKLQASKNPKSTIGDFINSNGLNNNATDDGWTVRKTR